MFSKVLGVLLLFTVLEICVGCGSDTYNTHNHYYNVVDMKDVHVKALGDYILANIKKERSHQGDSCDLDGIRYLTPSKIKERPDVNPQILAAWWLQKKNERPLEIFYGAEETIDHLMNGKTLNVLVDRELKTHRFSFKNSSSGPVQTVYYTEDELLHRLENEEKWKNIIVVGCESLLHFISRSFMLTDKGTVAFTVMDKKSSNDEMRFILASSGVGGFVKI